MVKSLLEPVLFTFALLLLLSHAVMAQSVATNTISGTVRDVSGAVIPGVTVEAASPALIERVRSVVTTGRVCTGSSICDRAPIALPRESSSCCDLLRDCAQARLARRDRGRRATLCRMSTSRSSPTST